MFSPLPLKFVVPRIAACAPPISKVSNAAPAVAIDNPFIAEEIVIQVSFIEHK
jgi:hypothetical protein